MQSLVVLNYGRWPQQPASVYVLAAGTFLMGTTEFVVAGLLPELAADFATTTGRAGLTITVFAIGMILGAPLTALLTLRLPQRRTLVLALGVFAIGHLLAASTPSFEVLLIARFASALATGAFWAIAAVLASSIAPAGRASQALGIVLGGGMLANVLGVPLGAYGGQVAGWRGPFWTLAVLAALLAVVVGRTRLQQAATLAPVSVRNELRALRGGRIWLALATCAAVNAGVLGLYSFISPLLTDGAGLPGSIVPPALLAFGTAATIGSVLGGSFGDRRPLRTPLVTASVSLIACTGAWIANGSPIGVLVAFTVLGLAGLSANPVLIGLVVRYGRPATVLPSAMATSVFNLGTAVGTGAISTALENGAGPAAVPAIATVFAASVFLPLLTLIAVDHRRGSTSPAALPPAGPLARHSTPDTAPRPVEVDHD